MSTKTYSYIIVRPSECTIASIEITGPARHGPGPTLQGRSGELLDQGVYIVATTQELHHIIQKFVRLTRNYLSMEGPLSQAMSTWTCLIDCFERQYDKSFTRQRLFGSDIMDTIHKRVQVFLHSLNKISLEDMEIGALAKFGKL